MNRCHNLVRTQIYHINQRYPNVKASEHDVHDVHDVHNVFDKWASSSYFIHIVYFVYIVYIVLGALTQSN